MAVYRSIPATFAKIHPRYFTPTSSTPTSSTPASSTLWMGRVSAALYLAMNWASNGGVIADAVVACGILIAFYYGMTGVACVWYCRGELTRSAGNFLLKG